MPGCRARTSSTRQSLSRVQLRGREQPTRWQALSTNSSPAGGVKATPCLKQGSLWFSGREYPSEIRHDVTESVPYAGPEYRQGNEYGHTNKNDQQCVFKQALAMWGEMNHKCPRTGGMTIILPV